MFVGKVIGTVWSTVKWPQLQGLKLLVVRPYHLADLADRSDLGDLGDLSADLQTSAAPGRTRGLASAAGSPTAANPAGGPDCEAVVCVDLLDAGVGDDVVVAFGHAARVAAQNEDFQSGQKSASGQENHHGPQTPPSGAIVPVDAAVVAIVDSIRVARPST